MKLEDYLARIGYDGAVVPDLGCLSAVHRQHLLSIPYENLDVQLGRPLDFDIERIFEKIVHRSRGGWCYEMNGLFAWALGEIGFEVTRMTGGVMRQVLGDDVLGNHLVLSVRLDGDPPDELHLADVGLGNGMIEPTPLREGSFVQGHREMRLERLDGDLWRFQNFAGAVPPSFDFILAPADERRLEKSCEELQSTPDSKFRQNLICERLRPEGVVFLLGRVLIRYDGSASNKRLLDSADELAETLGECFGLSDPEVPDLWPRVAARHEEIFGDKTADEISFGS